MPNCLQPPPFRRAAATAACCLAAVLVHPPAYADEGRGVRDNGCMRCHAMERPYVGPGFAQIAERYRNDKNAEAYLADRIRNGGAGEWGRALMPRHPRIGEEEARSLARWVLAQRKG